jgi:hypothetical protein
MDLLWLYQTPYEIWGRTSLFTLTGRGVRLCHRQILVLSELFIICAILVSLPAGDRQRYIPIDE